MNFNSKKVSLVVLAITAIAFSRVMFVFFNDPEGPNLLVVGVAAAIVYVLSLAAYVYYPSTKLTGLNRLLLAIFVQILVVAIAYFCLS